MSCKCCCTNVLDYCTQNVCNDFDLGVKAQIPGAHKLVLDYMETQVTLEKEFIVDEEISFPLDELNESYQYTCELYDPIGNRILISRNGINYDCFRFRTVMGVTHSSVVLASS